MRSMVSSLLQSINKVSEIDNRISHAALIEKFYNTFQLCNKDLYYYEKVFIPMNAWIAAINLINLCH